MSCLIIWCKSNKKVIVPQTFLLLSPTPVCAIVGGYGIPAIPTQTPNYLPTETTETTEVSDARYSPTDCTDGHRLGGYGILPYPRRHQTIFPQNPTQPNHLCASVKSVGGSSTPEISVNSVNSVGGLAEGGVGMAGMPYPPNLCTSVKSVGEYLAPEISVNSVNSVGELYAAKPSVCICAICGRIIKWAAWVWQGCHTLLSVLCWRTSPGGKTQRGHGGMPCPLTLVMWMRGYGKDAIPSYDYLTSTFLTLPSAVRTMFRPFWSLLSLTPLTVKNSTSPSATVVALMPVSGSLGAVQSLSTTLT